MSESLPEGGPSREIPDGHVASAASQFRDAASVLLDNFYKLVSADQLDQFNCMLPLLMLNGFAIELYLKSLNSSLKYHSLSLFEESGVAKMFRITSEPRKKGHSLSVLYDALDPPIKHDLERSYNESPVVEGCTTFRDALEPYNHIFVDSRYTFEGGRDLPASNPRNLMALVLFLGRFVEGMPRQRIRDEAGA